MSEPNPYTAPSTQEPDDESSMASPRWSTYLAPRGRRFLGSVLDGVFYLVVMGVAMTTLAPDDDPRRSMVIAGAAFATAVAVQAVLIVTTGQSVAKRLLGMRIVRDDGSPVGLWSGVILRSWIVKGATLIPYIGQLLGLIDAIFIFRDDHKCLHDDIAGTKVIEV